MEEYEVTEAHIVNVVKLNSLCLKILIRYLNAKKRKSQAVFS